MIKIIGIAGGKGVGKDTVANILCTRYGFTRMAFGDPIKEALASIFQVDKSFFNDEKVKEVPSALLCGWSPRYLMQTLGTEWGRALVSPDLWVDLLVSRIEAQSYKFKGAGVVIPDVRFPSEVQGLRVIGGKIWKVERKHTPYSIGDNHASENSMSDVWYDKVIDNNSGMDSLAARIGDLLGAN